jgi:two-component sensor histidine kinase/FixJ family two-component response regulator
MKKANINSVINILILEDNQNDFELILNALMNLPFTWNHHHCLNKESFENALNSVPVDIIITDHNLNNFKSVDAISILKNRNISIPFLVVSGFIDDDEAVNLIVEHGAQDYISKNNLRRLPHSVIREINNIAVINELEVIKNEQSRALKLLGAINDITTSLLDEDSLLDIANTVSDKLMIHFEFKDCVIYEYDELSKSLQQIAAIGEKKDEKGNINNAIILGLDEGIVGSVAKNRIPEIVNDTSKDSRYIKDIDTNGSELAVPIILDKELLGVIDSEHPKKNFYTELHLQNLETVASVIATKFKAAQAKNKSNITSLELQKKEHRLKQITEKIDASVTRYITTPSGKGSMVYASPKTLDIFEITPEDAIRNDHLIWDQVVEKDKLRVDSVFKEASKKISNFSLDFEIKTPIGIKKWIEASGSVSKDEHSNIISDTIYKDITERKLFAQKINQSEELLRSLVSNIPGVVIRYSLSDSDNGIIEYISEGCDEIYEVSQNEILEDNNKLWELIFPEDVEAMLPSIEESAKNLTLWDFSYRIKAKSGLVKHLHCSGTPRKDKKNDKVIWDTVVLDITETVELQQSIQQSLKEKTLLLSEIHHRVKNNLAIVTGLLSLQAMESNNDELRSILDHTAQRIISIAKVHELLYNTESFTDISFEEYVEVLIRSINESIKSNLGVLDINIEHGLQININQAIPLGLLVNELITNSYKYAFDDKKDENRIHFGLRFENSRYIGEYYDSGSGFDIKKLKESTSMGYLLIDTLLKQLSAEFKLESENGFKLEFEFNPVSVGAHSNL